MERSIEKKVLAFVRPSRSSFALVRRKTTTNLNFQSRSPITPIVPADAAHLGFLGSSASVGRSRRWTMSLILTLMTPYWAELGGRSSRARRQWASASEYLPAAVSASAFAARLLSSAAWTRRRQVGQTSRLSGI